MLAILWFFSPYLAEYENRQVYITVYCYTNINRIFARYTAIISCVLDEKIEGKIKNGQFRDEQ